jgi:hypothetical protein
MNPSSLTMHTKSALALSFIILLTTTIYSMERETPSDGSEDITLEQLSLESQEQQLPPAPANQPMQRPQQNTAVRRPPLQQIGSRAVTPPTRIRSIQFDGAEPSPAPSPQIITASPRPDTPNTTLSRAAEQALRDVDSGAITSAEALERIRQFLPPRSGRSSENRNPQSPAQNRDQNRN